MRRGVVALGELLCQRIAGVPRAILEVSLAAELDPLDRQRDAASPAELPHQLLVERGVLAKPVVHVERGDRGAEALGDVEQRHRVAPAGHHHEQRLARADEAALACGVERSLAHSSRRTARQSCRGCSKPFSFTWPIGSKVRCEEPLTASTTASLTSTSPPRARATTRAVRFTSRPK